MKKYFLCLLIILSVVVAAGCSSGRNGYKTYQEYEMSTLVSYNIIGVTKEVKTITNRMGGIIRQDNYYTVLYQDSAGNRNCETFNASNYGVNVILSTENRLDKTCEAVYINMTAETMNSMN